MAPAVHELGFVVLFFVDRLPNSYGVDGKYVCCEDL